MLKTQSRPAYRHDGSHRPDFAISPKPGQESVWDYPRPPCIMDEERHIEVKHGKRLLASSNAAKRVLETASPPTIYLPPSDIEMQFLKKNQKHSFCEWKGQASYYDLVINDQRIPSVAWVYTDPRDDYQGIKDFLCFYPSLVDCYIQQQKVRAQQSVFFGGWISDEIVGPFKGDDETRLW